MNMRTVFISIGVGTLLVTGVLVVLLLRQDAVSQGVAATITTADGVEITLKHYAARRPEQVAVFLPDAQQSQEELISVARVMQQQGIAVVSLDWRGTASGEKARFSNAEWAKTIADVDAAVGYAAQEYPKAKITLIGGDFGAVMAIHYAASHQQIHSVVALSPKPSARGVLITEDMRTLSQPVFVMEYVINPDDEEYHGKGIQPTIYEPGGNLIVLSGHSDSYYDVYESKATGWNMITASALESAEIIQWMKDRL